MLGSASASVGATSRDASPLADTSHVEDVFNHLDQTADYLTRRGLVAVLITHHLYAAAFLPKLYALSGSLSAEIAMVAAGVRIGYEIDRRGRFTLSLIFDTSIGVVPSALAGIGAIVVVFRVASSNAAPVWLIAALSALAFVFATALTTMLFRRIWPSKSRRLSLHLRLPPRLLGGAVYLVAIGTIATSVGLQIYLFIFGFGRAVADTVARRLWSAVRTVPWALAVLIVLFSTADVWRLFGGQTGTRFLIFAGLLGALSVIAVIVKSRDEAGDWPRIVGRASRPNNPAETQRLIDWACATPACGLVDRVQPDVREPGSSDYGKPLLPIPTTELE